MVLPNQMDRVAVFFDMSNLYFVARDLGVRIDYSRLLEFLVAGRRLVCAYAYVTLAGDESSAVPFLTWLRRNGFRVVTRTLRRVGDGVLRGDLDLELAVDALLQAPHVDVVVLVTGDGDYCYLVETIQRLGKRV
ncbi:MAG: NYN domain-containing protein, partial [Thermomicrobium sp.]|nr:NYN domain-containing protein [Thermomicrobium sp.]